METTLVHLAQGLPGTTNGGWDVMKDVYSNSDVIHPIQAVYSIISATKASLYHL